MATRQTQPSEIQIELLKVLYKYRFSSRQLIAETLGINGRSSLHERLKVLVKHGYVDMRYEKRLKLTGAPAAYYLTSAGLKVLRDVANYKYITDRVIKASYRDKSVSRDFINHTLNVHAYTNMLKGQYPTLKVFTKREMNRYANFPEQLPDAFLSLPSDSKQPKRFFLDLVMADLPPYQFARHIKDYCVFFDEGNWDDGGMQIPMLLFLCEKPYTERRVRKVVKSVLSRMDADLTVLTATMPALSDSKTPEIWLDIEDTDERMQL